MVDTSYFPEVLIVVLIEYLLIMGVTISQYICFSFKYDKAGYVENDCLSYSKALITAFVDTPPVELTAISLKGVYWTILLLVYRVGWWGFFMGYSVIYHYVTEEGTGWFYFTYWNAVCISFYYLFTSILSVMGLMYSNRFAKTFNILDLRRDWSISVKFLAGLVAIWFEIFGAMAFFIIIAVFFLLDPSLGLDNISVHLLTTFSFLGEIALNSMRVQTHHVIFYSSWAMLYIIYIWPIVITNGIKNGWPYFFLDTSSSASMVLYTALIVGLIIFYYIWYALSAFKVFFRKPTLGQFYQLSKTNVENDAEGGGFSPMRAGAIQLSNSIEG